jgi:ketosteroid isomerase-like protein
MKKILYLLIVILVIFTSCQPKSKPVPFDADATKLELTKTLDQMYLAYNTRDIQTFLSLMADDGLFCGTDPKNLWDKATYSTLMTIMFADPKFAPNISVDRREIRLEKDGNSATVVDQFFFEWNRKIAVRHIVHFVRTEKGWKCNFLSTTFIPDDADLEKIFNAVK